MNYDHRFHAGNFADVFKHVVLTRILSYLRRKESPFRVIDTHAGCGTYDLIAEAAGGTLEWTAGVGRLNLTAFSGEAKSLLTPYFEILGDAVNGTAPYPGSPALTLRLTRPHDRMIFCELHPAAVRELKSCVGRDRRAKVVPIDGYVGLNAFIPPVERRGLVLIDPSFEANDEFDRLADALLAARSKWRDGIFLVWYPIKDRRGGEQLSAKITKARIPDVLRLEIDIAQPRSDRPLASNGLIVVNPPYTMEAEMTCVLPELLQQLGRDQGAWRIDRLATG